MPIEGSKKAVSALAGRRDFLKTAIAGALLAGAPAIRSRTSAQSAPNAWDKLPEILARIRPPQVPARDFDVAKYGAVADNNTDCAAAVQKAIAACNAAGGGRVVVPKGQFLSGAVTLKSNVNLHISDGATLRFSRDASKYPVVLTRYEGQELMNYSPLIYALDQENIAITGQGTIDGNADCAHWWSWVGGPVCGPADSTHTLSKDRDALHDMSERGVPVEQRVFGPGHSLRPKFIQPFRCKNVLIEGVTLLNSPMWHIHPALCTNVTVQGLTIHSNGPNTDGCDPESCSDVLIKNCNFLTGDDCIAIKSGRNADGRRLHMPSENIVIQDCHMKDGHGGVTIGSEISGGVRNIFADNCQMDSPNLQMAIRIKNNAMRGGDIEDIYVRDIKVGQVANSGVAIDFYYEEGETGGFTPIVKNVDIRGLDVAKTKYAVYLRGFKNAPIQNIRLTDCNFEQAASPNVMENVKGILFANVRINGTVVDPDVQSASI
jgi:polygalacturonase